MKYVSIDQVEPGQFLGKTIFSSTGAVLLSEGVQLTVYMINTLNRIGATMIYIKDPQFEDVEIPEVLSDETKRSVLKKMTETFETIKSGKEFDTRSMSIGVGQLLEDVTRNREVLIQLSDIRTKDNEAYVHALNVCMMSTMIGINMNLNQTQLKELAIGALLHDIGKVDKLADDESSDPKRHHTWRGFEVLKQKQELNLLIAHVALQHHESPDGEGFPRRLVGDQIHLYAKIVAVANLFDNLQHGAAASGKRMLPHEACEHMMALAGTKLDRDVLIHFLRTVSIYPTGSSVRLSTKETGVVVGQHRGLPGRPVVRVVRQNEDEIQVKEIDLAKLTTVFVEGVLT
ncbi:HD-GYP domain-containing protein [Paenibacillus flagellatus]|uniref:Metal-dependent phosphohydrolase n=1 Tax=Paenibacillus flagellatus TaxID=2211139 RepID=A0A2V5KJQ4_9BACL|nr:HD domain-containing phosphohydrolase [Paenibacillus flagellatus]PYI50687.1 metal-dependent phosphohydrolase [Paenibacillus flagellatus]